MLIFGRTQTHARAGTLASGARISISSTDTLNSPKRDLVLLEEARKMTYLMHVNGIYTLGLTIIMNATSQNTLLSATHRGPAVWQAGVPARKCSRQVRTHAHAHAASQEKNGKGGTALSARTICQKLGAQLTQPRDTLRFSALVHLNSSHMAASAAEGLFPLSVCELPSN